MINVFFKGKELNLYFYEFIFNENMLSVMLFEMMRFGKIDVRMKEK